MNRVLRIVSCGLLLLGTAFGAAKVNVVVVDLEADGVTIGEAKTLTSKLRSEIAKLGKYDVVERNQMEEILKEQGFQQSGCTSQACAVEIGRLIGVKMIIAGNVGKVGTLHAINLRVIDVETGTILQTIEHATHGTIENVYLEGIRLLAIKFAGKMYETKRRIKPETIKSAKGTERIGTLKVMVTMAVLRTEPSSDAPHYTIVKNGTTLGLIGEKDNWWEIGFLSKRLWIKKIETKVTAGVGGMEN